MRTLLKLKLWHHYFRQKAQFAVLLALQKRDAGQILPNELWNTVVKNAFTEKMTCFHLNKGFQMVPTVFAQETIVVRKLPYLNAKLRHAPPQIYVGDVVVLKDPLDSNNLVVRRLAAVSGYEMVSNNEEDEPFVLEDGQCWVVSDNKNLKPGERNDSRTYGPISITDIVGRAMYRFRTRDNHGFIVNSPISMQNDLAIFFAELDSKEMLEHNDKEKKNSKKR